VLTALSHHQPDRVPRDFWAEEPTWKRLLVHAGYEDRGRLLDELGVDVRHLDAATPAEQELGGGLYQNYWGERYIYKRTPWGPMREDVRGALAEAATLADLESFDWPTPEQFDYSTLAQQCRRWPRHALLYGFADVW
jgi:uroporphyrinogen decarboxylase